MKKSLALLAALTVSGCGLSESAQIRVAQAACSALSATSKEDSLDRLQIINGARLELGAEIFSGSGAEIERYLRFGTCLDFIRNGEGYRSETDHRESAFLNMVAIDRQDNGIELTLDLINTDGSYLFIVRESREGDLYENYVLDSKTMLRVSDAELKGEANEIGREYDADTDTFVFNGELTKGRLQAQLVGGDFVGTVTRWHSNGRMLYQSQFEGGMTQGLHRLWHENGVLSDEFYMVDNELQGLQRRWNKDGELFTSVNWVNGNKEGLSLWWGNDQCFKNDEKVDMSECG